LSLAINPVPIPRREWEKIENKKRRGEEEKKKVTAYQRPGKDRS